MDQAIDQTAAAPLKRGDPLPRGPFTREEYYRMGNSGLFDPEARYELIDGELCWMHTINSPHSGVVNRLTRLLVRAVGDRALITIQAPTHLDGPSEPQPDVAVVAPRADDYTTAHPRAHEVFLLIEVADSSLTTDRGIKRAVYARNGIPEYWIVDLNALQVEVCRTPVKGRYTSIERVGPDAVLAIGALPGLDIAVRDFMDSVW